MAQFCYDPRQMQYEVERLGPACYPTPVPSTRYVQEGDRITFHSELGLIRTALERGEELPAFEMAGPGERLFFDPHTVTCAAATCGGLCPGLNDVIRGLALVLHHLYGVRRVYGIPNGYQGLVPPQDECWQELTPHSVAEIHHEGGTVLGSSRGPQDIPAMVDAVVKRGVNILFMIGGDGTLRGAWRISQEIRRRGLPIAVIGLPKTIDNDIALIERSFGFETAVAAARAAISAAHAEALGYPRGIGLVKLMGRHSGFLAAHAALSTGDVNICLVPEVPFALEQAEFGFLPALKRRVCARGHAVVVVAEGAGQELLALHGETAHDASGNVVLGDIGIFLRDQISAYFKRQNIKVNLKYIDPSYMIRSLPADPSDSAFCLLLAQHAVHAGMAGRTAAVVGYWNQNFTLVPIEAAVAERKRIDPDGRLWQSVLQATGQAPM
jgi:6-phosphofructokinase 1